ncbi:ADP,ATP carrier protein 1 [Chlamydiales bacterium STE3]|nr:ADP,ATP carrier protein 1 [Chlamydiales bacterium STE3]
MTKKDFKQPPFQGFRALIWPVHSHELKKLLPMLAIFFFISFDYNVLRTMKDTIVVTAKSSGAEVIPFIKVWVMFPGALLMTFLFTRLSNRFSSETVIYSILSLFLAYFFVFTFVVYPHRESLHAHFLADRLQEILPSGLWGFVAMIRYWSFTSFYVMSELWSNIIIFLLFWGFANQITRLQEAKRFYGLFGIGANFSGVAAGSISVYFCRQEFNPNIPFGTSAWEQSMGMLIILVVVAGLIAMGLFRWMNLKVLTDPLYYDPNEATKESKVKGRMSMRENFSYLFKSDYLIYLAIIVISYNFVINLVEVVWKHQVRSLYPDPQDYSLYMNQITTIIGFIATFTALFVSGNSIRKCGWTFTALLTPTILLITSVGFFGFFFFKDYLFDFTSIVLGTTPLAVTVFFGSAQNILSRAAKYTVFDATQQMAFIPLSAESRLKGKAAIDGVCSRLGKTGGSVVHQSLFLTFTTVAASAPYVAGFLFAIIIIWASSAYMLGKKFNALTEPTSDRLLKDLNNRELILKEQKVNS